MEAEDIKIGETYSFLDLMGIIDTAIIFDKRRRKRNDKCIRNRH